MTLIKYMFQGVTGQTVADGTAATLANLGIPSGGRGIVNAGTGGSVLFKTSAKFINTYGLECKNGATAANFTRFTPNAPSGTMARTTAISVPTPLPSAGQQPTIWNMVATTGTPLRIYCTSTGHLFLQKITGTSVDLGVFTAGQKVVARTFIVVGTGSPSTNGHIDFELQNPGGSTISGTSVSVTNADIGNAVTVTDGAIAASTGTPTEVYTVLAGYDLWDDGRTSFIPQEVDFATAVDSGGALSLDSQGSWTVNPSGTALAVVTDSNTATSVRSSLSPVTRDAIRFQIVRLNVATSLVITPDWGFIGTGAGTWDAKLYDSSTLKTSWTGTVAAGLPVTLTADSTICAGLTVDSGGAWSGLHLEYGFTG